MTGTMRKKLDTEAGYAVAEKLDKPCPLVWLYFYPEGVYGVNL